MFSSASYKLSFRKRVQNLNVYHLSSTAEGLLSPRKLRSISVVITASPWFKPGASHFTDHQVPRHRVVAVAVALPPVGRVRDRQCLLGSESRYSPGRLKCAVAFLSNVSGRFKFHLPDELPLPD